MICLSKDGINIYFDSVNKVGEYFNTSPSNIRKYIRENKVYKGYIISKLQDLPTTTTNRTEDNTTGSSYSSSYFITEDIVGGGSISIEDIYFTLVAIRFSILLGLLSYLYNFL